MSANRSHHDSKGRSLDQYHAARDHEPLIPTRALDPLIAHVERHIDPAPIFAGSGTTHARYKAGERLSWAQYLVIIHEVMRRYGQDEEALFQMARQMVRMPAYRIGAAFAGLLASPQMLYQATARWFAPATIPSIFPNTLEALPRGRFHLEIELRPGFTPAPHFFELNRALIATCTNLIGLGDALVTMRDQGHKASYEILPPPSRTVEALVRRAWDRWAHGSATVITHLEDQFRELQHTNLALQRTNQTLEAKIAELERVQRELDLTRAQHVRALNGTREGIWELDFSDGSLSVSPRWAEILSGPNAGYLEPQPVLTLDDWRMCVVPEDLDDFDRTLEEHLGGLSDAWDHTFRIASQEGERWLRVRARQMQAGVGPHEMRHYLSGSIADVTLEQRTRQDLPTLLQESPNPLCVASLEGQILFANRAFVALLSEQVSSLHGTRITSILPAGRWETMGEALESAPLFEEEQLWRTAHGTEREIFLKARQITLPTGTCVLMNVEDLAERRAEQARHVQMDRVISMGTMAASIGHEINNPMAYLQSNLEFATSLLPALQQPGAEARGELLQDLGASLEEALQGAQRVVKIVRDLRSFSRLRQHQDPDTLAPASLQELIDPAMSMVRAELSQYARAELLIELDPVTTRVRLDPSRMVQILTNLLINAAHAVAAAPSSSHCVTLQISPYGPSGLLFAVHDTGVGIAPADLPRLFDPFFTRKAQGKGTGLGLYICKILIEEMGGSVAVESEPGRGASFFLRFETCLVSDEEVEPEEEEEEARPDEGRAPLVFPKTRDMKKPPLLIIDDEGSLLKSFARKLDAHFEVHTCQGGERAIEALQGGLTPSYILCDVVMPSMSGVELFDCLRDLQPELCQRFVFMTGGSSEELLEQIAARGVHTLEKPVEQLALLSLLARLDAPAEA